MSKKYQKWVKYHEFKGKCHISKCKHEFDDYTEYVKHLTDHYKLLGRSWLKCEFCEHESNNESRGNGNFVSHLCTHTNYKPYKCKVLITNKNKEKIECDKRESTAQNLQKHITDKHGIPVQYTLKTRKKQNRCYTNDTSDDDVDNDPMETIPQRKILVCGYTFKTIYMYIFVRYL